MSEKEKISEDSQESRKSTAGRDYFEYVGGNVFTGPVSIPQSAPKPGSAPPKPTLIIGREDALQDLKTRLGILAPDQIDQPM